MKCKECKKLVHQMVDGELDAKGRAAVLAHTKGCSDCRAYHRDMAGMTAVMRSRDVDPPETFRLKWQRALKDADKPKKTARSRVWVPAVCCGAALVFVASTAIINPQALGLGGNSLKSQLLDVDRSAVQETPMPTVQDTDSGIDVQFFGKKEKKENVLDFDSADYSEITTTASAEPEISYSGEIVSQTVPEPTEEPRAATRPAQSEAYVWDTSAYEITMDSLPSQEEFIWAVHSIEDLILTEWDAAFIVEGPPEAVQDLMKSFEITVPEGTRMIRLMKNE